jgi:secreted trypsin-like serine protease
MRSVFAIGAAIAVAAVLAPPAPVWAEPIQDALETLRPSSNRIIGGTAARSGAWPWQVRLFIPGAGDSGFMCGGALIGQRLVLTAAHCFNEHNRSRPVLVFEQRRTDGGKGQAADIEGKAVHRVAAPIVHRQYNDDTHENDIALLRLDEPARSQPVPVLLRPDGGVENPPAQAVVTGWGWMRFVKQKTGAYVDPVTAFSVRPEEVDPARLMEVELPLVPTDQCRASYANKVDGVIDGRNLCAGFPEGGKDSCKGDSGGPMVVRDSRGRWVQTGVVSWGKDCALKGFPGVYTRVSAFAGWIRENAGRDFVVLPDTSPPGGAPPPGAIGPAAPDSEFDNAAGLAIDFDKGDVVRVGDEVSYRVSAHKSGYLAIFDAGPDNTLTMIFPNAGSLGSPTGAAPEAALLRADRPRLIPDPRNPYEGFKIQIVEPRGKGHIVAVLSDEPIRSLGIPDGPKSFATVAEAAEAIRRLRNELTRGLAPVGPVADAESPKDAVPPQVAERPKDADRPKWSVAIREYAVR